MHFNAVLFCYVILCPSTLVIRICIFLSYRITNLYLCCYFTNFITINLFIFSTGLDYFLTLRILYMVLLYVKRL